MAQTQLTGRPRILVTNDDGIDSAGLLHLALVAREASPHVVVAAPAEESSGSSAALTAVEDHGRIVVENRRLPGLEDVPAYAVEGLPGFIALIACQGAFGAVPDVVLSGINKGANTGHAVLHSGTVGAALTAAVDGRRAMAVSLELGEPLRWDTAARLTGRVLPLLMAEPPGTVFNLNIPNVELSAVRAVRGAELASFGAVQTKIIERGRGFVRLTITATEADPDLRTDAGLLAESFAALSVLHPLSGAAGSDALARRLAALLPLSA